MGKDRNILRFLSPSRSLNEGLLTGNSDCVLLSTGGANVDEFYFSTRFLKNKFVFSSFCDVSYSLEQIKENLLLKNYEVCENIFNKNLGLSNFNLTKFSANKFCKIFLKTDVVSSVYDYFRTLNLNSGEVQVGFCDRNGQVLRSHFVSRENNLTCFKIQGFKNRRVDIEFGFLTNKQCRVFVYNDFIFFIDDFFSNKVLRKKCFFESLSLNNKSFIVKNKRLGLNFSKSFCLFHKLKSSLDEMEFNLYEKFFETEVLNQEIFLKGKSLFGLVARVICNEGEISLTKNSIVCTCAKSVEIFLQPFFDGNLRQTFLNLSKSLSYDLFFKKHFEKHLQLMNSTSLSLSYKKDLTVEEELLNVKKGIISPSLIQKLYDFGKFIFICVSGDLTVLSKNLFQNNFGLFDYFFEFPRLASFSFNSNLFKLLDFNFQNILNNTQNFHLVGKKLFNSRGLFVPPICADNGLPIFFDEKNLLNINTGAVLCVLLFQYYLHSSSITFLKSAFSFFEGVGYFYLDFFNEQQLTNVFSSPFSISPLNTSLNTGKRIATNCVIDFNCAKMVFDILIKSCSLLGLSSSIWEEASSKLPSVEVDENGSIKEYNCNSFLSNYNSPYVSFLFPYNIGLKSANFKRDYESLVQSTVKFRYINAFGNFDGGNLIDIASTLFSCGEGNDGFKILSCLIKNFLNDNLIFSQNSLFLQGVGSKNFASQSVDKNVACCALIQNMFFTSSGNNIFFFNSFPNICHKGFLYGLKPNSFLTVNLDFNLRKRLFVVKIFSSQSTSLNIFLPSSTRKVKGKVGKVWLDEMALKGVIINQNKTLKFKFFF